MQFMTIFFHQVSTARNKTQRLINKKDMTSLILSINTFVEETELWVLNKKTFEFQKISVLFALFDNSSQKSFLEKGLNLWSYYLLTDYNWKNIEWNVVGLKQENTFERKSLSPKIGHKHYFLQFLVFSPYQILMWQMRPERIFWSTFVKYRAVDWDVDGNNKEESYLEYRELKISVHLLVSFCWDF